MISDFRFWLAEFISPVFSQPIIIKHATNGRFVGSNGRVVCANGPGGGFPHPSVGTNGRGVGIYEQGVGTNGPGGGFPISSVGTNGRGECAFLFKKLNFYFIS